MTRSQIVSSFGLRKRCRASLTLVAWLLGSQPNVGTARRQFRATFSHGIAFDHISQRRATLQARSEWISARGWRPRAQFRVHFRRVKLLDTRDTGRRSTRRSFLYHKPPRLAPEVPSPLYPAPPWIGQLTFQTTQCAPSRARAVWLFSDAIFALFFFLQNHCFDFAKLYLYGLNEKKIKKESKQKMKWT